MVWWFILVSHAGKYAHPFAWPKSCTHSSALDIPDVKKVWQHLDNVLYDIAFFPLKHEIINFWLRKLMKSCGACRGKGCWSWQCLPRLLLELVRTPWIQQHLQVEQWHPPDTTWCSQWPMDPSDMQPGSKSVEPENYRVHITQPIFVCASKEYDSNCDNEKSFL